MPNKPLEPTRRVLLKSVVLVAVLAAVNPFLFRYGLRLSLPSQSLYTVINFALFVSFLSFEEWLKRKREMWGSVTERRFKMIMLSLALVFFYLAIFLFFHR
jgi:hypothetical protein